MLDEDKADRCVRLFLCQVCGLECEGAEVLVFLDGGSDITLDGGPVHGRCARTALALCPELRDSRPGQCPLVSVPKDRLRVLYDPAMLRERGRVARRYEIAGG